MCRRTGWGRIDAGLGKRRRSLSSRGRKSGFDPMGKRARLLWNDTHTHTARKGLLSLFFSREEKKGDGGGYGLTFVRLPQSLSIRSRAASRSCSENKTPSFSTASSETVLSCECKKAGCQWGWGSTTVSRDDHVARGGGKRAEDSHGFRGGRFPVRLGVRCKRSRMTFFGKIAHFSVCGSKRGREGG